MWLLFMIMMMMKIINDSVDVTKHFEEFMGIVCIDIEDAP